MVLSASAAADREGPGDADWIERITRVFARTRKGVLFLCNGASPGRLRDLVVGLCEAGVPPAVVANPTDVEAVPVGSVVVLAVEARDAAWLNMVRPVFAERALRVVLFTSREVTEALRKDAPDFFDWISHMVECPPLTAAPHAVLGLRAALRARAEGIEWRGDDLVASFGAALPGRPLIQKSATMSEEEMVATFRGARRAWVAWRDVHGFEALRHLRRAQASARRRTRIVLVRPAMVVRDFWPVHDRSMALEQACAALQSAGAASPGRLAALAGLEPEAIELVAKRLRAGEEEAALERGLREAADPGAWIAEGAAESDVVTPPEWRAGRRPRRVEGLGVDAEATVAREAMSAMLPEMMRSPSPLLWAEDEDAEQDAFERSRARDEKEAALRREAQEASVRGDRGAEAKALLELGRSFASRGAWRWAQEAVRESITAYRMAGNDDGEGRALAALANLLIANDHIDAATDVLRAARELAERSASTTYAQVLRTLGDLFLRTEHLNDAEASYQEALSRYRVDDDRIGEANALLALGNLYQLKDRFDDANAYYQRALALFENIDHRSGKAHVLLGLGGTYKQTDRFREAEAAYTQALALFKAIDHRLGEANVIRALGDLYLHTHRLGDAEACYKGALSQYQAAGAQPEEASVLASMGSLALERKEVGVAFAYYLRSLARYANIEHAHGLATAHSHLARAALVAGNAAKAAVLAGRALRIARDIDSRLGQLLTVMVLPIAFSTIGKEEAATAAQIVARWHVAALRLQLPQDTTLPTARREAPSDEDAQAAYVTIMAAVAELEQELAARGEDPYAPLPG